MRQKLALTLHHSDGDGVHVARRFVVQDLPVEYSLAPSNHQQGLVQLLT